MVSETAQEKHDRKIEQLKIILKKKQKLLIQTKPLYLFIPTRTDFVSFILDYNRLRLIKNQITKQCFVI